MNNDNKKERSIKQEEVKKKKSTIKNSQTFIDDKTEIETKDFTHKYP